MNTRTNTQSNHAAQPARAVALPQRETGIPAAIMVASLIAGTLLMILFSQMAGAEESASTADVAAPVATRSAGDMTVEERAELMQATNAYQRCVYDSAIEQLDASPDVRAVADMAFDACRDTMQGVNTWFADRGFDEGFATGYTRQMRDRAGRKLLPELMMRKSGG